MTDALRAGLGAIALFSLPFAAAGAPIEFRVPTATLLDNLPAAMAVGDIDGDGNADIVVSHYIEASLSVLRGTGQGRFVFEGELPVSVGAIRIYIEDLDGDGIPDLAVSQDESDDVNLLRGEGGGTFAAAQVIHPGHDPVGLAFADVDGDTILDIMVALSDEAGGQVSVMRGQGGMQFELHQNLAVANDCVEIVVHDFDGDGRLDAATTNPEGSSVSLLRGIADGKFELGSEVHVGPGATLLELVDVDVDGLADLVVGRTADQMISVLRSRGDGTFEAAVSSFSGGRSLNRMVVTDANADGFPDIVTSHLRSQSAGVLVGNGDGTFANVLAFTSGVNPVNVGAADFNGDGHVDVVSANEGVDSGAPSITLLLGDGSGRLEAPEQLFNARDSVGAAVGDFTGDGIADAVVGSKDARSVVIFPGARGVSSPSPIVVPTDREPEDILAADLDDDGHVDIVILNDDNLSLLFADGAGGFSPVMHLPAPPATSAFAVIDFDGDGDGDLVVSSSRAPLAFHLLRNDGNRVFTSIDSLSITAAVSAMSAADIDGDGREDLITNDNANRILLFVGSEEGGLRPLGSLTIQMLAARVAAGDVDANGAVDVIGVSPTVHRLTTFLNDGGGIFGSGIPHGVGFATSLALRDLDGDALPDAIVPDLLTGETTLLQSQGAGGWRTLEPVVTGERPAAVAAGDLDDDGRYDLVITGASVTRLFNETAMERGIVRGDGNDDGRVTAADFPALASELFDGDGKQVESVARGVFVGGAGADADGDGVVIKADLRALLRRIY